MKILVLNAAALHLGYLGCYGNEWVRTPTLDRLAAEGVVFDQHYVDSPAMPRTSWTGRYRVPDPLSPDPTPDLPALLQAQAIPFALVKGEVESILGTLDRLAAAERWLVWADLPSLLPPWRVSAAALERYFADEPEESGRGEDEEFAQEQSTPLTHPATGPINRADFTFLDRLQSTYAAAVTQRDGELGDLIKELERAAKLEEVLLLITADRGLALGEHGIVGDYRPWLHDELIHLPLIVRLPHAAEAGRRIAALTQPVDLLPTLLDLFGLPALPGHGHSLLPLLHGGPEVRPYVVAMLALGEAEEWALRTPDWGFVLPVRVPAEDAVRGPQLYVKPDDRWEVNNVVQHHMEFAEGLERTLRDFVVAVRQGGVLPPLPEGV